MVVVVDGVMTIQGDVNNVHKAKDHSRIASGQRKASQQIVENFRRPWRVHTRGRAGCVERCQSGSGKASSRPLVRENEYGAMILFHRAKDPVDIGLRDRVERQLDWAPEVPSTNIGVAAEDGVVTLTGFVNTYAERLAAERVTLKTYGVKGVANDIEVKPLFKKTDADIATVALNALKERVDVPDENIQLTVRDGWLTLEGKVEWFYQKNAAEFAVKYLSGVKGVTNSIQVLPTVLTGDVKSKIEDALKRGAEVEARRISVQVHDGKVTLRGNVRSWFEKQEAASAAWSAPGVKEVNNDIAVVP